MDENTMLTIRYFLFAGLLVVALMLKGDVSVIAALASGVLLPSGHLMDKVTTK